MRRSVLARRRALTACACLGLTTAAAGCTAPATSNVSVQGKTLTIYMTLPPSGADARARDVAAAEQLAFAASGGHAGTHTVKLARLDGAKVSDNARTAIQDSTAIAYLGETEPGQSAGSIGITNAQELLQVSPTDTAVELTQATSAVPGAPAIFYENKRSYGQTFARLVPNTALEAKALGAEMRASHVSKLYIATDGQPYGMALAQALRQDAGAAITVTQGPADAARFTATGADAVFFAGANPAAAAGLFDAAAQRAPHARLFAASALAEDSFAASLSPAAQRALQVSSPGFLPADLTAQGRGFVTAFQAAFHHRPATEAIFGYEAMAAVLSVLRDAGAQANNRATVVHDFLAIRNRTSVLGTYSIRPTGDTDLAPFVFSRASAGRLVPYKFVSEGR